jgi:hypothetical protein
MTYYDFSLFFNKHSLVKQFSESKDEGTTETKNEGDYDVFVSF